jgi:hypothetical protein
VSLDGDLARFSHELSAARCLDDVSNLLRDHAGLLERVSENNRELLLTLVEDHVRMLTE